MNIKEFAQLVADHGGQAYYVGGYVRDRIMGKPNDDVDIEVHGLEEADLLKLLRQAAGHDVDQVGASFGVYKLKLDGVEVDVSLPRSEVKTGDRHTDFDVQVDPYIGSYNATLRRDLTINAMMEDILTGYVYDPHNGIEDIGKRVIRHVGDKFAEDPLRAVRVARFAARYDFDIADETVQLCRSIDINHLPRERVLKELEKAIDDVAVGQPMNAFLDNYLRIVDPGQDFFPQLNEYLVEELGRLPKTGENDVAAVLTIVSPKTYDHVTNESKTVLYIKRHGDQLNDFIEATRRGDDAVAMEAIHNSSTDIARLANAQNPGLAYQNRVNSYCDASRHFVTGKDLLEMGYQPGKHIRDLMTKGRFLAYQGATKDDIVNQLLSEDVDKSLTELGGKLNK